jgi:hypothetical protein
MCTTSLRIAAIQPICRPGSVADNLRHLEALIGEAAARGAELAPLPGWLPDVRSSFPGFSHIADSDGCELKRLGSEEGVIVAEVTLDPAHKHLTLLPNADCYRPWVVPVPDDYETFAVVEFFGRRSYQQNKRRFELACPTTQEDAQ